MCNLGVSPGAHKQIYRSHLTKHLLLYNLLLLLVPCGSPFSALDRNPGFYLPYSAAQFPKLHAGFSQEVGEQGIKKL